MGDQGVLLLIGYILISGIIYFIPSMIATRRDHPNMVSIFLLNLILGWTFLGWVGALVWSFSVTAPQAEKAIGVEPKENKKEETDSEWEVIKKYVPEVKLALEHISEQLDIEGVNSAEDKLRELFFVLGKDGLTQEALAIVIKDVKRELLEKEQKEETKIEKSKKSELSINQDLIEKLKGGYTIGFNKKFQTCEICNRGRSKFCVRLII